MKTCHLKTQFLSSVASHLSSFLNLILSRLVYLVFQIDAYSWNEMNETNYGKIKDAVSYAKTLGKECHCKIPLLVPNTKLHYVLEVMFWRECAKATLRYSCFTTAPHIL